MSGIDLVGSEQWHLAPYFGFDHPLLKINAHTVMNTWIMLGILSVILIFFRWALTQKKSIAHHLALTFVSYFISSSWSNNLNQENVGRF